MIKTPESHSVIEREGLITLERIKVARSAAKMVTDGLDWLQVQIIKSRE